MEMHSKFLFRTPVYIYVWWKRIIFCSVNDAAQDVPTYWVEKLNGRHTVQVVPTHWVETISKCTKL